MSTDLTASTPAQLVKAIEDGPRLWRCFGEDLGKVYTIRCCYLNPDDLSEMGSLYATVKAETHLPPGIAGVIYGVPIKTSARVRRGHLRWDIPEMGEPLDELIG